MLAPFRPSLTSSANEGSPSQLAAPLARPASCPRAPCLKRVTSVPLPEMPSMSPAGGSSAPICSFAAPRSLSAAAPKRQVHFDNAPPAAYYTHSAVHYDRTPIECTQGGSQFDLSLPPRCSSYGEDADDEAEEGPDSGSDFENIKNARATSFGAWSSCTKEEMLLGLVGSEEKPKPKPETDSTSSSSEDPNTVSLPVHGVRSFGGLGQRSTAAFEAAIMDALPAASPDATPMPSPSVSRSMGAKSYFARSSEDEEDMPMNARMAMLSNTPENRGRSMRTFTSTTGLDWAVASMAVDENRPAVSSNLATTSPITTLVGLPLDERIPHSEQTASSVASCSPGSLSCTPTYSSPQPGFPRSDTGFYSFAGAERSGFTSLPTSAGTMEQLVRRLASGAPQGQPSQSHLAMPILRPDFLVAGSSPISTLSAVSTPSLSSPISSRCSSVDTWSGSSSDGTDSPPASWLSSSCTSPDLLPADGSMIESKEVKAPGMLSLASFEQSMLPPSNQHQRSSSQGPSSDECAARLSDEACGEGMRKSGDSRSPTKRKKMPSRSKCKSTKGKSKHDREDTDFIRSFRNGDDCNLLGDLDGALGGF